MKKITIYTMGLMMAILMLFGSNRLEVHAAEEKYVEYDIEFDEGLEDAVLTSSSSYIEDGRLITIKEYLLPDGSTIVDTMSVSAVATLSSEGRDTATRTRKLSDWGTITITATFDWYTEGAFSYVKCVDMDATKRLSSGAVASKWEKSSTSDYVSLGKAKAQVSYYIYDKDIPTNHTDGTFTITCSDSGTISDNA